MPSGIGLAGRVLREGKTVRLDRYGDLDQPTLQELNEHSVIGVPILWGNKMIGFFGIGNEAPNGFNERDAETLELFAQYAAIAINNANLFEASQHALDEMRLLYDTSQRIAIAGDVNEVISAYLEQVAGRGRYTCNVCLYDFDTNGQRVEVVVRGRWTPTNGSQRLEERVPYSRDDLDPPLDAGQAIMIDDVRNDTRVSTSLRKLQEDSGRLALAMIPLMIRNLRIGLVVLSYPGVHKWSEDNLRPYAATAAQLAIAIDSRMQQSLLYERGQQLAVLRERQRLARELHDSVTQLIFSTTLIAQSIAPAMRRDPVEGESRVNRLLELSQSALREMRSLLFELQPRADEQSNLESLTLTGLERVHQYGLFDALNLLAKDFSHDGIKVKFDIQGNSIKQINSKADEASESKALLEENIYRIIQESLNNAVKHSQARNIIIRVNTDKPNSLCLSVMDNGVGFTSKPADEIFKGSGLGMSTMRERAEAIGGNLRIVSAPGEGTVVDLIIPIKEVDA
jgi:signal transduction histidine kinase